MSRVFEIEIIQPNFNELYGKYEKIFGTSELQDLVNPDNSAGGSAIPFNLTEQVPRDIQELSEELNKSSKNNLRYACMNLIKEIIALSIIRKFQKEKIETELRNPSNNEYYNLAGLLNKSQKFIEPKLYAELLAIKFINNPVQNDFDSTISNIEIDYAIPRLRLLINNLFK
jgi:hypothetical protein